MLHVLLCALTCGEPFDQHFTERTLRWDYFHTGTKNEEHFCHDRFRQESGWGGSRTRLVDDTGLGLYVFEIVDPGSGTPLFSRGFCSIFGEWQTTQEAAGSWRSFHESQRFPEPLHSVELRIQKRAADGTLAAVARQTLDPSGWKIDLGLGEAGVLVCRAPLMKDAQLISIEHHGLAESKVDLLFLGDGYQESDLDKLVRDVMRLSGKMFEVEPYRSRRDDFNLWAVFVPADEPGVTDPRAGQWRNNPFGLTYNSFDTDRYMLTFDNRAVREAAAKAPYDAMIVLANSQKYGGGGIFNLWSTASADSSQAPYLVVHEFGHAFAGLADEYYTSQVAYVDLTPPGTEPWEPNITALLDLGNVKWKQFLEPGTPLPTQWRQAAFDTSQLDFQKQRLALRNQGKPEAEIEKLFEAEKVSAEELLAREPYRGKVGAFEGAGYMAKGLYRPELDCIMFTRNPSSYCRVCARAVERMIDFYSR